MWWEGIPPDSDLAMVQPDLSYTLWMWTKVDLSITTKETLGIGPSKDCGGLFVSYIVFFNTFSRSVFNMSSGSQGRPLVGYWFRASSPSICVAEYISYMSKPMTYIHHFLTLESVIMENS